MCMGCREIKKQLLADVVNSVCVVSALTGESVGSISKAIYEQIPVDFRDRVLNIDEVLNLFKTIPDKYNKNFERHLNQVVADLKLESGGFHRA